MSTSRLLFSAIGLLICPAAAFAADPVVTLPSVPLVPSASGDWTVTIGVGGAMKPSYVGADHSMLSPKPIISVRRAGTAERFKSLRDNASFALIDYGRFRAGPVGAYRSARKAGDHDELRGLNDIKFAIEIGGFAEYYAFDWLRVRSEVRRGFGGHKGIVADFSADVIVPLNERMTFSVGPRYTLTDAKYASTYFSVSAIEALASGLPAFDAKGGSHSVGAGAQLRYKLDPQWEVRGYVEYDKLLGSAADSPLVTMRGSSNQITYGLGLAYSFDVGVR
ncbi:MULTISPECIES: MipA/OmpV family protein [Rhodopseudomonas]|uniref:Membrane protein n=1 Tax=Rhodopseudomonas palustris TaxID=1076 RepID=A0A0D7E3Z0_RHOPL|nr:MULTISPECIES: MipA/OmpV family protein [Rhodopseudomonas]KIZ34302.1 membrane protein [Rhodopseudomonas palustris]MDF3809623.1 MipA/OmpV family protein [Rhodopseudomonas sp. BAL398]WOK17157.1 MipA/OmpV family protein [Rhodopseudomonas sp. BAL398]